MEYQVKTHGISQIEIKVSYPLFREEKNNHYVMTAAFFIPSQLGIKEKTRSRENLLSDLTVHTRFTTPRISLEVLNDSHFESSPVSRLEALWKKPMKNKDWRTRVIYELQTLVNILISETGVHSENEVPAGPEITDNLIHRIQKLIARMSGDKSAYPRKIKQPLIWTLEAMTGLVSDFYIRDLQKLNAGKHQYQDKDLKHRYEDSLNALFKLRKKYGWDNAVDPDDYTAERMVFRSHKLKKWSQKSLYLSVLDSRAAARVGQFFLGLAAAVAMAFALMTTLLSTKFFPQGSIYWALVAVIAYSLKDRIKENLRKFFLNMTPFLVSDRIHFLIDPRTGKKCGRIRESVSFADKKKLPGEFTVSRQAGKDRLSLGLLDEEILKYKKDFTIRTGPLFENHTRLSGITDIVRLDISNWLQRMDDSRESLACRIDGRYGFVQSSRVYHVNLVLKIERPGTEESGILKRFRLIMGRKGVVRIEEIHSGTAWDG